MDGPKPKKRNPASAGTGRGADRKNKFTSQKSTTPPGASEQEFDNKIAVYDGQTWLGDIRPNGRRYDVFAATPSYRFLGRYGSVKEAADAISDAAGGAS